MACREATEGSTGSSHREVMSETYLPELPTPGLDNDKKFLVYMYFKANHGGGVELNSDV